MSTTEFLKTLSALDCYELLECRLANIETARKVKKEKEKPQGAQQGSGADWQGALHPRNWKD